MQRAGILQPCYILPDTHNPLAESSHQNPAIPFDIPEDEIIPLEEARKLAEIDQIQRALRIAAGTKHWLPNICKSIEQCFMIKSNAIRLVSNPPRRKVEANALTA